MDIYLSVLNHMLVLIKMIDESELALSVVKFFCNSQDNQNI